MKKDDVEKKLRKKNVEKDDEMRKMKRKESRIKV